VINTFNDKPATLSLGTGELSPAMEQRLLGLAEGTRTRSSWPPARPLASATPTCCSGWPQAAERAGRPRRAVHVGDVVQFPTPDGAGSRRPVVQVRGDGAVLFDFNHPLAGQP
jgi:FKBP-type peptidyl-prolyl cis-trans isomerase SlpA